VSTSLRFGILTDAGEVIALSQRRFQDVFLRQDAAIGEYAGKRIALLTIHCVVERRRVKKIINVYGSFAHIGSDGFASNDCPEEQEHLKAAADVIGVNHDPAIHKMFGFLPVSEEVKKEARARLDRFQWKPSPAAMKKIADLYMRAGVIH